MQCEIPRIFFFEIFDLKFVCWGEMSRPSVALRCHDINMK